MARFPLEWHFKALFLNRMARSSHRPFGLWGQPIFGSLVMKL
jgi:hypothetical protein